MQGFKDFIDNGVSILDLYMRGEKIQEISRQSGKSIGEIYRTLEQNHISPNRLKKRHDSVISLADAGLSLSRIANFSGYTERNIRYILSKVN